MKTLGEPGGTDFPILMPERDAVGELSLKQSLAQKPP